MENRSAIYTGTLIYVDEPQLITLKAYKTRIIAVAIPSEQGQSKFLAASVSTKNWSDYIDGFVDLRFLFTYAEKKTLYTFDLMKMSNEKVNMRKLEGSPSEEILPRPHFFSRNHTEDEAEESHQSDDEQTFYVDGEWDLPDFGSFYSKYSDVYYFLSSASELDDPNSTDKHKEMIADAFRNKAFAGGFSYVHFYGALSSNRPRSNRLNMHAINYSSPGHVSISGDEGVFNEVKDSIALYLGNKEALRTIYNRLYNFLSKNRLLVMAGQSYDKNTNQAAYIYKEAKNLADSLGLPNIDAIYIFVDQNPLVFAKVVLSFQRRLEEASRFFAQGRMAFGKD